MTEREVTSKVDRESGHEPAQSRGNLASKVDRERGHEPDHPKVILISKVEIERGHEPAQSRGHFREREVKSRLSQ